tara:strand:+ start:23148 stop:23426 length:279 start_codon:yes stop_codon:yes gene_type:complete
MWFQVRTSLVRGYKDLIKIKKILAERGIDENGLYGEKWKVFNKYKHLTIEYLEKTIKRIESQGYNEFNDPELVELAQKYGEKLLEVRKQILY